MITNIFQTPKWDSIAISIALTIHHYLRKFISGCQSKKFLNVPKKGSKHSKTKLIKHISLKATYWQLPQQQYCLPSVSLLWLVNSKGKENQDEESLSWQLPEKGTSTHHPLTPHPPWNSGVGGGGASTLPGPCLILEDQVSVFSTSTGWTMNNGSASGPGPCGTHSPHCDWNYHGTHRPHCDWNYQCSIISQWFVEPSPREMGLVP